MQPSLYTKISFPWIPSQMEPENRQNPSSFRRRASASQEQDCKICWEVPERPVHCIGPCRNIFCTECVSRQRLEFRDKCPFCYNQPFLVSLHSSPRGGFLCPYDNRCEITIRTQRAFDSHHQVCRYAPLQLRRLKNKGARYECLQGHQLQFFTGSQQEMMNSKCAACDRKNVCRSVCRRCHHLYCVKCRSVPCSRQSCPLGHPFFFRKITLLNYHCDRCGLTTGSSGSGVYDDSICNMGICQACFEGLPAALPPEQRIARRSWQCSSGHHLQYVKSQITNCKLCGIVRQCTRYCAVCQQRYCVQCKIMRIFRDLSCVDGHQLHPIPGYAQPSGAEIVPLSCMHCGQEQETLYLDEECSTRLCQECIEYSISLTFSNENPAPLSCRQGHPLFFQVEKENSRNQCCECGKTRVTKLACRYCQWQKNWYCVECRPPPEERCYYSHNLSYSEQPTEQICQCCNQDLKSYFFCSKCFYFICEGCRHMMKHPHIENMGDKISTKPEKSSQAEYCSSKEKQSPFNVSSE